jgi:hypothetical protein
VPSSIQKMTLRASGGVAPNPPPCSSHKFLRPASNTPSSASRSSSLGHVNWPLLGSRRTPMKSVV